MEDKTEEILKKQVKERTEEESCQCSDKEKYEEIMKRHGLKAPRLKKGVER